MKYTFTDSALARPLNVLGMVEKLLWDSDQSTVFMNELPPGAGAPKHLHHQMEEGCKVLEGSVTFTIDGREILATAGHYIHIADGVPHSFINSGHGKATLIWFCSPGRYWSFFEEAASLDAGDREGLVKVAARHHTELL
jgi:quercetin dioxygenase-like cupin family protein